MKEIGQEIRQARLDKGIKLEEIAERTRIQIAHLQKIEDGQFDFLPRPYVVAFIKTFTQQVGLNGEELIRRWHAHEHAEALRRQDEQLQKSAPTKTAPQQLPSALVPIRKTEIPAPLHLPYLKEIAIGFGMILVMAALIYWMLQSDGEHNQSAGNNSSGQTRNRERTSVREIPFSEVYKEVVAKSQAAAQPETTLLTLHAQFDDPARMRVISDGSDTSNVIYQAGERHTWQAKEKFDIRIGNAGNVRLILDGKNIGRAGPAGQIAYLTITRDGIVEQRFVMPRPRVTTPQDSLAARPRR
jgi:cytoskeletal protein RodZ